MRKALFSILAVAVLASSAFAASAPVLPDYAKEPFKKIRDCHQDGTGFHPEWTDLTCELYANSTEPALGASAVWVFKNKDGSLKYASWLFIQEDGCPVHRGYNRVGDSWVFEKDHRPCDEEKRPQ